MGLADRKRDLRVLVLHILIVVVHKDSDCLVGEPLSEHSRVLVAHKKHVLLIEFAARLLGHVQCAELLAIDELTNSVDWLVLGVCFKRNVFHGGDTDLKGIQLLAEVGRQKTATACDLAFKPLDRLGLASVKVPFVLQIQIRNAVNLRCCRAEAIGVRSN